MELVSKVEKLILEASQKPIGSIETVKAGDQVIYKPGTEHAGMAGFVVQIHAKDKAVDLKFGKATRMMVPISDLMLIDNTHGIAKDKGGAAPQEGLDEKNAPAIDAMYNQIDKLDMKFRALHRRKEATSNADQKANVEKMLDQVRAQKSKLHAKIKAAKAKLSKKKA